MKLRTTILAIAALGLVAGGLTAPVASADSGTTEEKQNCYQVYFFVYNIGPVTIDASDSCWEVIVHGDDECDADPADLRNDVPSAEACLQAIDDMIKTDEDLPPIVCLYPVGC